MAGYRLATGGRIDRRRPLSFTFNGRGYQGYAGDTLASALLANGVQLVARSFKYHRPRGIVGAGSEEPNALVQLETGAYSEPNLRATQVELYDGLTASSVNAWPSVAFDVGAVVQLASPLLAAGFYYKTFLGPKLFWDKLYEPVIRRMAGLGKAPPAADPDRYDKMHAHCDVLVVGAGPAGLAAALAASRTGARVIVADEQPEFGGGLLGTRQSIGGAPAIDWVTDAVDELAGHPETVLLPRTTAFGYYDDNYLCLVQRRTTQFGPGALPGSARQRLWHVRAKRVVLATGAHERLLAFADNDRPGVMLAGAVRTYLNRYAVAAGRRAVLFTNNDYAYRTALDLLDANVNVAAVVDARPDPRGPLPETVRRRGIEILASHAITATRGTRRVTSIDAMRLTAGKSGVHGQPRRIECDLVAMSGGWDPAVHLFSQSQGKLRWDQRTACFRPERSRQAVQAAGNARGAFQLSACLTEGFAAGAEAASAAGFGNGARAVVPPADDNGDTGVEPLWVVPRPASGRAGGKRFIDLQNDVVADDIDLAVREGMVSVEHVKRYTTAGLGTDQGKISNVGAFALTAAVTGRTMGDTGTTTFRPPYTPVTYGALAGRDFKALLDPIRGTPMHDWHVARGAVFEDVGQWKRPRYYPEAGETMDQAVLRECRAARTGVAVMDASTLGKIDIQGPDAVELLNRIYTNSWTKLPVGSCRYGLMLKEDGMVFDDGVTTRIGEHRFLMTTTTGGAARVLDWLEEWLQTEWPDLRAYCTSVTEQWATVAVVGPKSRQLLQALAPDMALDNESFPFMTYREGVVAGMNARVFRISFSGELAFEINVPSWHGALLWEWVMYAGQEFGIVPYGTEAMHVLRAEKGFIIVGQDTDGTVTPYDLGMDWIVAKNKDFIGRRSLRRPDTAQADRKQLVGLLTDSPHVVLPEGSQIVRDRHDAIPAPRPRFSRRGAAPRPMLGHVTSSYFSGTLGRSFALALIKSGRQRMGETIYAALPDGAVPVQVVSPVFYDKEGARRDG